MLKSRVGDITHPIFIKCCEHACDKYWVKVFEDLAVGKMPFGVYLSRCMLYFKGKCSDFIKFENKEDNGKYNHDIVYSFLSTIVGVMSPDQKIKKQSDFDSIEIERNNWMDIKKKTTKDLLIELYAIDMKNIHKLSLVQTRYLISVICMALLFKSLGPTDITIKNGRITDIKGIVFVKDKIIFDLELYNNNEEITSHTISLKRKRSMIDNWKKYLDDILKIEILT